MAALSQQQGTSDAPTKALKILLEQQTTVTAELARAQEKFLETKAKLAGGDAKAAIRIQYAVEGGRVDQLQHAADELSDRISAAEAAVRGSDVSVGVGGAGTGVAIVPQQDMIFTLKPAEFYSALGFVLWFPVMVAFARRIWKGTPARSRRDESLDANPQISRLEQAVEAIAIEVERISEAQRFSAKLLAERPVEPRAEQASRAPRSRRPVITPLP